MQPVEPMPDPDRDPIRLAFEELPSPFRLLPLALLDRSPTTIPAGRTVPAIEARAGVRCDRRHLQRYRKLCGFRGPDDCLPPSYPLVLALPLMLAILTHEKVPIRLLGVVHLGQRIRQSRDLRADEPLVLVSRVEGHQETDRGQEIVVQTEAFSGDERVWEGASTILVSRREGRRRPRGRSSGFLRVPEGARMRSFEIPGDIGRRFGMLTGDLNPIHLWSFTSQAFGFRRPIVHGTWSLARSLAVLGAKGPMELEASFKLPLSMPGEAKVEDWEGDAGRHFLVSDAVTGRPHLSGLITGA